MKRTLFLSLFLALCLLLLAAGCAAAEEIDVDLVCDLLIEIENENTYINNSISGFYDSSVFKKRQNCGAVADTLPFMGKLCRLP